MYHYTQTRLVQTVENVTVLSNICQLLTAGSVFSDLKFKMFETEKSIVRKYQRVLENSNQENVEENLAKLVSDDFTFKGDTRCTEKLPKGTFPPSQHDPNIRSLRLLSTGRLNSW